MRLFCILFTRPINRDMHRMYEELILSEDVVQTKNRQKPSPHLNHQTKTALFDKDKSSSQYNLKEPSISHDCDTFHQVATAITTAQICTKIQAYDLFHQASDIMGKVFPLLSLSRISVVLRMILAGDPSLNGDTMIETPSSIAAPTVSFDPFECWLVLCLMISPKIEAGFGSFGCLFNVCDVTCVGLI